MVDGEDGDEDEEEGERRRGMMFQSGCRRRRQPRGVDDNRSWLATASQPISQNAVSSQPAIEANQARGVDGAAGLRMPMMVLQGD